MSETFVDHYRLLKYGYKTAFPVDAISSILRHAGGSRCVDCGVFAWQTELGTYCCQRCGQSLCDSCFHYPAKHPHVGYT